MGSTPFSDNFFQRNSSVVERWNHNPGVKSSNLFFVIFECLLGGIGIHDRLKICFLLKDYQFKSDSK